VVRDSRNQKKSITHTTGSYSYLDAELNHSDEAKFSATITKVMASIRLHTSVSTFFKAMSDQFWLTPN
jgi:hypothetical protein